MRSLWAHLLPNFGPCKVAAFRVKRHHQIMKQLWSTYCKSNSNYPHPFNAEPFVDRNMCVTPPPYFVFAVFCGALKLILSGILEGDWVILYMRKIVC